MPLEMGQYGIRVNSLQCGLVDLMYATRRVTCTLLTLRCDRVGQMSLGSPSDIHREGAVQNALGRMGRLDELRGALLWLSSDASAFCTGSEWVLLSLTFFLLNLFSFSIVMNGGRFM